MAARLTKCHQVALVVVGAVILIGLIVTGLAASIRLETQRSALIKSHHLNELLSAAGLTNWHPPADFHWFELRFGVLLVLSVVGCGRFLLLVIQHGAIRVQDYALQALFGWLMLALSIWNFNAIFSSPCMGNPSGAIVSPTPDAEARFNQQVCSAWCHLHANSSVGSSCGAPSARAVVVFAKEADVSQWCEPVLHGHTLEVQPGSFRGVAPFDRLRPSLPCAILDQAWSVTLLEMVALVFALSVAFCLVFTMLAVVNFWQSRAPPATCDMTQKPRLTEKLVGGQIGKS